MNNPKLHHYVPRLYLKNFANHDSRLCVYDKHTDSVFVVTPGKIATEREFYTLPPALAHLGDPLSFESAFAKLEGRAASLLARLVQQVETGPCGDKLEVSSDDRIVLSEFISWQYFRTLEMRDLLLFLTRESGISPSPANADDEKAFLFSILGGAGFIEEMSASIHEAIWLFARNASETPLVTSDHPVCVKTRDSRMWIKGIAPLGDGSYIVLPLSPNVVLYCKDRSGWAALSHLDCSISPVELDAEMVEHENNGQAFMATRFLFSNKVEFDAIREFIPSIGTNHFASESTPDSDEAIERTAKYILARATSNRR